MLRGRYFFVNHQLKGNAYAEALRLGGYYPTANQRIAKFLLTDRDVTKAARVMLDSASQKGIPCILYPHSAAPPSVRWDGMYKPHPAISLVFVHAEGHRQVMESYQFPHRVEVAGWSYSPIREFAPSIRLRSVLFAPIHPNHNGWLSQEDQELNRQTQNILLELAQRLQFDLKIRYLRFLSQNGLERVPGVTYIRGAPDLSYRDIEEADLVVSHETFAFISVALGKPTLMMGEHIAPRLGHSPDLYKHAENWDRYKHLMMYPLDILNTPDPEALLLKALQSDEAIRDWKLRMIGKPFNRAFVLKTVKELL